MQWYLDFTPAVLPEKIEYNKPILIIGSCFADEIGRLMQTSKLDVYLNPAGILFNPLSIINILRRILNGTNYKPEDLFTHNGLWHSYEHHGQFSGPDKQTTLDFINIELQGAQRYLFNAEWLLITLGSAHAYFLKETGQIVANCHKVPGAHFEKKLLTGEEIITAFDNFIYTWRQVNPKGKILFTVSPVKYKKDGLVGNNLSKAILIQSVHHMVNKYPGTFYFPAYELVTDVLRDYRFYKEDLVHPNAQAINFVWQQFVSSCFSDDAQMLNNTISQIVQAASHKPLHPGSEGYKLFMEKVVTQIQQIQQTYPYMDFSYELTRLMVED